MNFMAKRRLWDCGEEKKKNNKGIKKQKGEKKRVVLYKASKIRKIPRSILKTST